MTAGVHPKPQRLRPVVPAVLALGANLGDREATIRSAVDALGGLDGVTVDAVSRLFETPALTLSGVDLEAPAYLNAVALIHTILPPHALLDAVNAVENDFGRVREERWGDRTLDVDIVDYDGRELHDERLTLPHPRAAERGFVLIPWLDVDPDAVLTGHGRVAALAQLASDKDTVVTYAADSGGAR
jgi:2-amino-4-hydroxy-6-hydroxymethyldihydropteridine diphosphokinase